MKRTAGPLAVLTALLLLAPAQPATAAGDTTPPVVTSVAVSPLTVNVDDAASTVTVTARITDDLSGVATALAYATPTTPGTSSYHVLMARTTGANLDGTWTGTLPIPQHAPSGTYKISIYTTDNVRNAKEHPSSATVTVTGKASDSSPPSVGTPVLDPTIVDVAAGTATVSITARITDDISGVATALAYATPTTPGTSSFHVLMARTTGANLDGTWTGTLPIPQHAPSGTYKISIYTTDNVRNAKEHDTGATLTVTETADTQPPVLELPSATTAEATGPDGAAVTYTATATDAIDGPTGVACSPASGSRFPLGATTVECRSTDRDGHTSTGRFAVTVVDRTGPALRLPSAVSVDATGESGATVEYVASATDLVDGAVRVACAPASGGLFPIGSTTVACTGTDSAKNVSTGSFTVTVARPPAPVLRLPGDLAVDASGASGARVRYTAAATGAGDRPVSTVCAPAPDSVFPLGSTKVTCSATSSGGTVGGSFSVTVLDRTAPVLLLPAAVTVDATSTKGAAATYGASAHDAVDGPVAITCTPASGTVLPAGRSTVSCSASDAAGNRASRSFAVTVKGIDEQVAALRTFITDSGRAAGVLGPRIDAAVRALAAGRSRVAAAALRTLAQQARALPRRVLAPDRAAHIAQAAERAARALDNRPTERTAAA